MSTPHRVQWLGLLAKLVTPGDPTKSFAAMDAFFPFLADLPDDAFTRASLEHVAMAPRRLHIPDLREVKEPLAAWWRDNKPARRPLPAPPPEPEPQMSEEERQTMRRQLSELADRLSPPRDEKPRIRAHVVPSSVLAEARAKLRERG